jgi:hypothetical protein
MRQTATSVLILIALLGVPSIAAANAGTPLMWASALHMLIGNAVIGVLEGGLLARVFKVRIPRAIVLMILANYFSAWLGWACLADRIADHLRFDLYNAWRLLWTMVAAAYFMTILLEWPFVAGCFARHRKWFRKSCVASVLIQTVSYILLFAWYGLASGTSLYTTMSIVHPDQISLPKDVLLYYIADDDGDVYARELGTGRTERICDLHSTDLWDCLSFEESASVQSQIEIVALLDSSKIPDTVRIGVSAYAEAVPHDAKGRVERPDRFTRPSAGQAAKLGEARSSPWTFDAGYWPIEGLHGENAKTGARIAFAFETPFARWAVRHPVVLSNDCVIFQLGERQICVLEPETRKIALLAFGRGPVAIVDQAALAEE